MPLFAVSIKTEVVVYAESEKEATTNARLIGSALNWDDPTVFCLWEIKKVEDLPEYWTPDYLPYCTQSNKMISEYL